MSQFDFGNIDEATTSGNDLGAILEQFRDALHTNHKGPARPAYAVEGTFWIKDGINPMQLIFFDGTIDVVVGTIDAGTGQFRAWDDGVPLHAVAKSGAYGDLSGTPTLGALKITAADTTPNYLTNKLLVSTGLALSTQNPGANETRTIAHDFATQAEATTGSDNTKPMNALRVAQSIDARATPSGTIFDFAGTALPAGYLECNGAAVSRVTFAALFTAIGTTWGVGDGSSTFNVPDLNRRTTIGRNGIGNVIIGNVIGNTGGTETHTLSIAEMPAHTHQMDMGTTDSSGTAMDRATFNGTFQASGSTGGGGAHNNIQPSAVVMKIIKT